MKFSRTSGEKTASDPGIQPKNWAMWLSPCLHLSSPNQQRTKWTKQNIVHSPSVKGGGGGGKRNCLDLAPCICHQEHARRQYQIHQSVGHSFCPTVLIVFDSLICMDVVRKAVVALQRLVSLLNIGNVQREILICRGVKHFFPQWWKSPVAGKIEAPPSLVHVSSVHKAPTGFKGKAVPKILAMCAVEAK